MSVEIVELLWSLLDRSIENKTWAWLAYQVISCECMIVDWLLLFFSSQRKQKYFDGSYKLDWNPRSSAGRYVRENCSPLKVRASSIHLFINHIPACQIALSAAGVPPAVVQDNECIILKIFFQIFYLCWTTHIQSEYLNQQQSLMLHFLI